jgi:Etoposide-induced protein 2.4 (EI24)
MVNVFNAFWRAAAYCLHPRLIGLSLLPVLLAGGLAYVLAKFFWADATDAVRIALDNFVLLAPVTGWLNEISNGAFRDVIGPLVVVSLCVPVLLISAMLLVSAFMGSVIVDLVARRRFPDLERRRGGSWWGSLAGSLGYTLLALVLLLISIPFWLIPPLVLLLPPLIWGWLSFKVMSYDALAEHASRDERRQLMREHRWPLLAMGLITGYLGAVPSLVWATGAMMLPLLLPLLLPAFVWLYTLVFAFACAWFTHYGLAALAQLRRDQQPEIVPPARPPALPDSPRSFPLA